MPHICSATFEATWHDAQPGLESYGDARGLPPKQKKPEEETPSECGSLLFQSGFTASAAQAALM